MISLVAIIAYVLMVQYLWGWSNVFATWQHIGWGVFFMGMGFILVTHLLRGLRMYHFFKNASMHKKMHFTALFYLSQTHNLLNNLLPFRSGEVSFPLLMKNQFGTPLITSTAGLLWLRFLDAHTLGMFALAVILVKYQFALWLITALLALALLVPVLVFVLQPYLKTFIQKSMMADIGIISKIASVLQKLLAGLPQSWQMFFSTWLLTWLNWLIKIILMGVIVAALLSVQPSDFSGNFLAGLAGAVAGEITSILPINAPAGVGTYAGGVYAGIQWVKPQLKNAMFAGINLHLLIMLSAFFGVLFAATLNHLTQWRRNAT